MIGRWSSTARTCSLPAGSPKSPGDRAPLLRRQGDPRVRHRGARAHGSQEHLRGLDRETFVDELTKVWARINYVHPFREGNTRAQFAFFTQLSADAGYSFQTARFQPAEANLPHENSLVGDLREQFVWGRFEYMQTGDTTLLRETIDAAVVVASAPPDRTESTPAPSYDLSAVRTATAGHPRPIGRMLSGSTESRGESVEALGPERAPAHDAGYEL